MTDTKQIEYNRSVERFKLEDRIYGDVHSEMWKLGYRGHHEPDCRVWRYFGREVYEMITHTALEYTCLEADYLKIKKKGEGFKKMGDINRCDFVNSFCYMIPMLNGKCVSVGPMPQATLKMEIMAKYNGTARDEKGFTKIKKFKVTIHQETSQAREDGDEWKDA